MTLFNFSRRNHLSFSTVVADADYGQQVGWWLNGRVCGFYVSWMIPWRRKVRLADPPKGAQE